MAHVYLSFKNCGLISTKSHYKRGFKYNDNVGIKGDFKIKNYELGHNLETPIPYTLLSNVLHVLCGEIPVPTNKPTMLKRISRFDEIAKTAKYYIENGYTYTTSKGDTKYIYKETIRTKNHAYNSHLQGASTDIVLFDGTHIKTKAVVNWVIFDATFPENTELREIIIGFINKVLNCDCKTMGFLDVIKALSEYWYTEDFEKETEKLYETLKEKKHKLNKPWEFMLLGKSGDEKFMEGCNIEQITNYSSNRPLLNPSGVGYKINISGLIGFELDDNDAIIELLMNGTGMANMLEQGIVELVYIGKTDKYSALKRKFQPIFSEKSEDNKLNNSEIS